ncbi:MAG: TIGR01440 family protein [Bacillaceae bacterium]|nr:TIGR01440 family protein [Bacillaceae bacterium]
MDLNRIPQDIRTIVEELLDVSPLADRHILVVGVSTSEVLGKHIGTAGSEQVAAALYEPLFGLKQKHGFHLAFQCCEHLNRALVVERETADRFGLEEVTVIPQPGAGGSMSAYAYRHMENPVVVERIQAHAGIDIGDTLIGMHLKPVAVPVRPSIRQIGDAHVTMARTRPKLIGGARACYE